MGDLFCFLYKYYMKIQEATQILFQHGFILEDTETEEDRLDAIRGDEWRFNAQYDRDHDYSDYHNIARMVDIRKRARELQQSSVEQKIANAKKFNGENPKEVNSLNNYAKMLKSLGIEIDEYKVGRAFDDAMDAKPGYIQFDLGMGKLKKPEKIIIVRGELNFEGKQTKLTLEVVTEYSKALVKTLPRVEKEVSGVSEAKEEIIKYCHSVVAKDKLSKFVNGVFRGSVPPYVSIAGLIEATQILHDNGYLVEYTDPDDIWSDRGSVGTKEPDAFQNLLKLKEYYPDMQVEKQQYGKSSHYAFTPNDKCRAFFAYAPYNKSVRLYVRWEDDDRHEEHKAFKLTLLEKEPAFIKKVIDKYLAELGVN